MRYRLALLVSLLTSLAWGQQQSQVGNTQAGAQQSMPNMSMGEATRNSDAAMSAMHSMEGTMNMGPHMKVTAVRPEQPGDAERAHQIAEEARKVGEKYVDYHAALAAGFMIFHPEIPQKIYHFVNYGYAEEADESFNPDHPTALLYEKRDDDYKLVGVMYTAPRYFTEDELNRRIPLSIAQWHEHVNDCTPPPDQKDDLLTMHPQFGLRGSIATKDVCAAAGGVFHRVVFNWMVHVYPFEKGQANIWSVERQQADGK
jgi:hypothetical protein